MDDYLSVHSMDRACELRWCLSGEPASIQCTANTDDGCFLVWVCARCAEVLGVYPGGDWRSPGRQLPEPYAIEILLRNEYRTEDIPLYGISPIKPAMDAAMRLWRDFENTQQCFNRSLVVPVRNPRLYDISVERKDRLQ